MIAAIALTMLLTFTCAAPGQERLAKKSAAYLRTVQSSDGGFSEPGAGSELGLSCWCVMAGTAAGEDAGSWKLQGGSSTARDYLVSQAGSDMSLTDTELLTLALARCGADPRKASGRDLVALIKSYAGDDGKLGEGLEQHCLGMMALRAAGEQMPAVSIDWLLSQQGGEGAWDKEGGSVTAATALAAETLSSTGGTGTEAVEKGLKYLRTKMVDDGGFPERSGQSDSQETARVVRAIVAAGQKPSDKAWDSHGSTPESYLQSMQSSDGRQAFSKGVESEPSMTTALATLAFAGKSLSAGTATVETNATTGAVHDDGTTGAGMVAGKGPPVGESTKPDADGTDLRSASGGAFGRRAGWFSGLYAFLAVCAFYLVMLVALSALAYMALGSFRKSR